MLLSACREGQKKKKKKKSNVQSRDKDEWTTHNVCQGLRCKSHYTCVYFGVYQITRPYNYVGARLASKHRIMQYFLSSPDYKRHSELSYYLIAMPDTLNTKLEGEKRPAYQTIRI